jgi:hypothetical protein
MGAGTLALAALLWATAALPPDVAVFKERSISIPITINENKRQEIHDLYLFVSADQGVTWNQEGRTTPDRQAFPFVAPNDGMYWFAIVIVDHNGRRQPADLKQVPANQVMKVLFDTQPPIVQLRSAERTGDDVTVTWAIQEMNPVEESFRLEYRAAKDAAAQWTPVQVKAAPTGTLTFRVNVPGAVMVRLSLQDYAQNTGQAMKTVGDDATSTTLAGYPPTGGSAAPVAPVTPGPAATPVIPAAGGSPGGIVPLQPDPTPAPPRLDPPALDRSTSNTNMTPIGSNTVRDSFTAPRDTAPPLGGPASPSRPEMRNIQLINSKQVTFDYKVNRAGPSGVRRAILYMTSNDGQTWTEVAEDRAINYRVTASIPGEGVYGFFLVLESGAGLSRGAPVDGVDQPQKRVEVDTTPPEVNIYEPAPDPNSRDTLILRWSATDKNLSNNRVTLEYAASENGPWMKIADVPNTGQYPWKVPTNMQTPRVFLKVTARDMAGNEGIAKSAKPQLIDLNKPDGELGDITKTTVQIRP